jgi:hypothetical protein
MKIKLVFDDWRSRKTWESVYQSHGELSEGLLHSGTTFDGEIQLDKETEQEMKTAIAKGFIPVFWVALD